MALRYKLGRGVQWDGDKEHIPGDDEANKLLGGPKHVEGVKKMRSAIAALEKKPKDAEAVTRAGGLPLAAALQISPLTAGLAAVGAVGGSSPVSEELDEVFGLAAKLKERPRDYAHAMDGKTLAMIFEKASTRTRVSFDVGATELGAHAIVMSSRDIQLGRGDVAGAPPQRLQLNGDQRPSVISALGGTIEIRVVMAHLAGDGQ